MPWLATATYDPAPDERALLGFAGTMQSDDGDGHTTTFVAPEGSVLWTMLFRNADGEVFDSSVTLSNAIAACRTRLVHTHGRAATDVARRLEDAVDGVVSLGDAEIARLKRDLWSLVEQMKDAGAEIPIECTAALNRRAAS
jgi:hypothetical protein